MQLGLKSQGSCQNAAKSMHAHVIGWNTTLFDADYGEPVDEICHESATNSSVFVREYSKATVQMDCTTWTPLFTFKSDATNAPALE